MIDSDRWWESSTPVVETPDAVRELAGMFDAAKQRSILAQARDLLNGGLAKGDAVLRSTPAKLAQLCDEEINRYQRAHASAASFSALKRRLKHDAGPDLAGPSDPWAQVLERVAQ